MKHTLSLSVLLSVCGLGFVNQGAPAQICPDPIPLIEDTFRIGPNTAAALDQYGTSVGISGDWAIG